MGEYFMKEHIHWQKLKGDTVNGYGVQVTYTFTSFDFEEIDKMEKFCNEFIKAGVIVDGVRAYDIDEYKAKYEDNY
jgi:hypothetical protein